MRQPTPELTKHSHTTRRTVGGSIAFVGIFLLITLSVLASRLVAVYVLGGVSAVVLRKAYFVGRALVAERRQTPRVDSGTDRRPQSR
ncbi:hypothetical protein GRX03_03185 [Halovenus sp. WSH3]|uniref:Uncharacterized protein n=1 Tax=Halovenus carboxidivorans TaxID=2692199 RepID=A0A6B0SYG8_9EURY|nr:hypothetical protein [Halovenus carboxidivorans]MXR50614.1 hypothetical protein [Halovenus carboxidivorans]